MENFKQCFFFLLERNKYENPVVTTEIRGGPLRGSYTSHPIILTDENLTVSGPKIINSHDSGHVADFYAVLVTKEKYGNRIVL